MKAVDNETYVFDDHGIMPLNSDSKEDWLKNSTRKYSQS
jgi:hypothetical protein